MDDDARLQEYLSHHPTAANRTINILVLGAPNSGKRSICSRLAADVFPQGYDPTEDGQYRRQIKLAGARVMVVWTTILADARIMIQSLLRHMVQINEAYVLVYRSADRGTFEPVKGLWQDYIAGEREKLVFVVANGQRDDSVSEREGRELADGLGATFLRMDAKSGDGAAEEDVVAIARAILLHRMRQGTS